MTSCLDIRRVTLLKLPLGVVKDEFHYQPAHRASNSGTLWIRLHSVEELLCLDTSLTFEGSC